MIAELKVGPQVAADSSQITGRATKDGAITAQDIHARFHEATYRGGVYSGGMAALTAINAATFTSATLGATCTPIAGVWNPANSPVNLAILQAILGQTLTALVNTGGGPFIWAVGTGQSALTLGNAPLNRKTLAKQGSQAKDLSGVALTGLTGSLIVACASALFGGSAMDVTETDTAAGFAVGQQAAVENIDGSFIVPPGGILALLATSTPVAHSAVSGLVWEEITV